MVPQPQLLLAPILGALFKTSGTRFIRKELLFSVQNKAVKKMAKLAQTRKQTAPPQKLSCPKVP